MEAPPIDLAPITRHLRAKAGAHLLAAAVNYIPVFEVLSQGPLSMSELQQRLGLGRRPAMVLFPALCAMGLLQWTQPGVLQLSQMGHYLTAACRWSLAGYVALEKEDPGVVHMAQWLLHDGGADKNQGLSFVKDERAPSPMDEPEQARFYTMALAGRARCLAPLVAQKVSRRKAHLLDVAGGTGFYTYAWLLANPGSTATILDRPEVLKVAAGLMAEFIAEHNAEGLRERVCFMPGDMLRDPLPQADMLFAFSLFHDWEEDTCQLLCHRFAAALRPGGELWIHDAFLNDALDGPLAVTDYSAQLFLHTRGRAYSAGEYRQMLAAAGLQPSGATLPTMLDYALLSAKKP